VVLRTIRPYVVAFPVLLPIFPTAFVSFAIRVVKNAESVTIIRLELSFVSLTVRPHIDSLSILLATLERPEEQTAIRPLIETLTAHAIVGERTLEHLTPRCDASAPPVDLSLSKVPLEDGIVRVNLKAETIRFASLLVHLSSVFGTGLTLVEVQPQASLGVHFHLVRVPMLEMIEWSQFPVNILNVLI